MADDMIERMVRDGFKAIMDTPGMSCDTLTNAVLATRACLAAGLRALADGTQFQTDVRRISGVARELAHRLERPDE
jgi:tagatose-1,6-bisphosphate aldolase non-catalytic subunit AgaZ/GatZ